MYKKISIKIALILVTAAFLTVPSSVLQVSHAQSNVGLQKTILDIHNEERRIVGVQPLTWDSNLAADAQSWATYLTTLGLRCTQDLVRRPPHDQGIGAKGQGENLGRAARVSIRRTNESRSGSTKSRIITPKPIRVQLVRCAVITLRWSGRTRIRLVARNGGGLWTPDNGAMDFLVCRYSPPG